jgi:hypothetical protein
MRNVEDSRRTATAPPATMQLDEAFDRVSALDFEIPNPYVNHGPMACEALTTLGFDSELPEWVEHFETTMHRAIQPVTPTWGHEFPRPDFLGDYRLLPEWMGFFERVIDDDGWRDVVRTWVPRLMPGLVSALFHGVIRTSHAVRAMETEDTRSRRAELARALGNWAVWFGPGQPAGENFGVEDPRAGIVEAAAQAAGRYVAQPTIFALHGVTGAMAVYLLSGYLEPHDAVSSLAQLEGEHGVLYRDVTAAARDETEEEWDPRITDRAIGSFDAHQVKLTEACLRGFTLTGHGHFIAAARAVTGTPSREDNQSTGRSGP